MSRESLSEGGPCPGGGRGLCSVQWDLCLGGLCQMGSLSGRHPHMVKSRWYASYWNAFLF